VGIEEQGPRSAKDDLSTKLSLLFSRNSINRYVEKEMFLKNNHTPSLSFLMMVLHHTFAGTICQVNEFWITAVSRA